MPLQVAVLDQQNHKLPTGKIGEVCINGPNVTKGYLNRPEANQEAFAGAFAHRIAAPLLLVAAWLQHQVLNGCNRRLSVQGCHHSLKACVSVRRGLFRCQLVLGFLNSLPTVWPERYADEEQAALHDIHLTLLHLLQEFWV